MVQKQVLAPRMIQSMEILQLPILALSERIEQEMEENPVLEIPEEEPESAAEAAEEPAEREVPDAPSEEERELVIDEAHSNEGDFERLLQMDEQWPDHFEERSRPSREQVEEAGDRKLDAMANMVARPQSLQDYLADQLGWFDLEPELRALCERIIANLDTNGYLQGRLEDLLGPGRGKEDLALAQRALGLVQKLDPPGIAARDLRECLLLQLTPGMTMYEELKTLISNHLEDLEHNRMPIICRKTGYGIEFIQSILVELRKLHPKPGADFINVTAPSVTPDVFVELDESGKYTVRLEESQLPSLHISPYYRKLLQDADTSEETREYIKRKVNSAQWLIESIEQRRSTVTKVSQAIVDHQIEFLNKGPEAIEPLKMQQIADKGGRSRHHGEPGGGRQVDPNAARHLPAEALLLRRHDQRRRRGSRLGSRAAEAARGSSTREESKQHPLSDDQLVAAMAGQGITVARRTITKYRKAMNIPSSRQRRDWTAAGGEAAGKFGGG